MMAPAHLVTEGDFGQITHIQGTPFCSRTTISVMSSSVRIRRPADQVLLGALRQDAAAALALFLAMAS